MATEKRERQRANRELKNQYQRQEQRRQTTTRRLVIGAVAVVGGLLVVLALAWFGGAFSDDVERDSLAPAPTGGPATTAANVDTVPATVETTEPGPFEYGSGECPPESVDEPVRTFDDAPQLCIDPAAAYTATIATSEGDIVVDLDTANTPGTVNNFVTLARSGYYDDTLIFRADPSIEIVQGGGADNSATPGYSIPDEGSGFTYSEGQIVMARTPEPNSAGAQWFIVTGPAASNLDAGTSPGGGTYVVFGTVTEGLEIAQEMVEGAGGPDGQTPSEEVAVETITVTEDGAAATGDTITDTTGTASTVTSEPAASGPATAGAVPTTTSGG